MIDIVAWHPDRRALLVIELKMDIVDVNELIGTFDRKGRLSRRHVASVALWVSIPIADMVVLLPARYDGRKPGRQQCVE